MTEAAEVSRSCGGCRFWERFGDLNKGSCRRRAPTPTHGSMSYQFGMLSHIAWAAYLKAGLTESAIAEAMDSLGVEPSASDLEDAYWPWTAIEDWCGEHELSPAD